MSGQSKKRCIIISGSPEFKPIEITENDYVIACDDGLKHALKMQVKPDLVVGDFDSFVGEVPDGIKVLCVAAQKDDTDTMLAVKIGLEQGFMEFILLGVIGGRLDHTLANLATGAYIAEHGGRCSMVGLLEDIYMMMNQRIIIPRVDNCYVSVFAYSEQVTVTYSGLKYPLTNVTLQHTFPLGVSNEFSAEEAVIDSSGGIVCIIVSKNV